MTNMDTNDMEMYAKARAWMDVPIGCGMTQADLPDEHIPSDLYDYVALLLIQDERQMEKAAGYGMAQYYRQRRAEKKAMASTPEALAEKAALKASMKAERDEAREIAKAAKAAAKEADAAEQKAAKEAAWLVERIAAGVRCSTRSRAKLGV